jgi:hypothetical protein
VPFRDPVSVAVRRSLSEYQQPMRALRTAMDDLIGLIKPNRQDYIAQVRLYYGRVIDGVTGGCLYGWYCLTAVAEPVALDLFVDDQPVLSFLADVFPQDLLDAGFGTGHHGFSIDLARLGLRPGSVIRIRVATRGIELDNSGRRLDAYGG